MATYETRPLLFFYTDSNSNSPAVIYSATTSCVCPCQHSVLTPFIIGTGIRGFQLRSHGSSACQRSLTEPHWWIIKLRAVKSHSLTPIPFFQRPFPARLPISPSGWQGPALCCCRDPRASSWAAGDPCLAAPDTAPPSPPRQNTTPARKHTHTQWHEENYASVQQTKLHLKTALLLLLCSKCM